MQIFSFKPSIKRIIFAELERLAHWLPYAMSQRLRFAIAVTERRKVEMRLTVFYLASLTILK